MQSILLVGAGGALGAMARFGFSQFINRLWPFAFPFGTLLINIIGSVLMGMVVGALARFAPPMAPELRFFISVGFLGGFTTFSSFSLDTVSLLERGEVGQAALYVALSVVVCVAGLYLGILAVRGGAA
jgi:CrcB protein